MKTPWFTRRADLMAGLALTTLPTLLYPLAATRRGVFYVGDVFRFFYPQRAVYADALRHGHLPLWTPDVLAGFPLLAEVQTGVFYPLNLLLYRILPIDVALTYSVLLALSLAGVAMYTLGRVLRLKPAAALLAALTFTYGGFFVGHLNHLNIVGAAPWLPIELVIVEKVLAATRKPRGQSLARQRTSDRWSATTLVIALGLAIGIQFLAGRPQISLMSILVVLAFGLFRAIWPATGARRSMAHAVRQFAPIVTAVALGFALSAVQLLPTWELAQQSVRAGGLSAEFLTSFSWHPALLATLVVPFALGNPYPNVSVELAAYLGILPLVLALVSPVLRRDRLSAFLVGLAGLALVLAFGDHTPLYAPLARIPVLNFFRAPARFLYLFTLAVALLAGCSLDAFLSRGAEEQGGERGRKGGFRYDRGLASRRSPCLPLTLSPPLPLPPAPLLIAGSVIVSAIGIRAASLDTLLALRWVLPVISLVLTGGLLILAWQQRVGRRTFVWAAIGLTLVDLYAFGAVYRLTYNDLMPVDEFYDEPASLSFFPEDTHNYRTLTHQAIVPALSVMRASLYPNISLLHQIPSANGWFPLTPARHARYLADTSTVRRAQDTAELSTSLTPGRLNLLNARYFLIPQLLPVDPETERYDLHNPFTPDPIDRTLDIPPTWVEVLELVSFTSQSADWSQGELVAEIVLTSREGRTVTLPIRAGQDTAEWAYDRSDVVEQIAHDRPPVARTWPARSGFPPEDHPGHAYRARYRLPSLMEVNQVQVISAKPAGLIHIEELALVGRNTRRTLAELLGLGRHKLVYRDPDVVIYENLDALPRAFVVHHARAVSDDETALSIIDDPNFDPCSEVLLAGSPSVQGGRGARGHSPVLPLSPSPPLLGTSAPLHPCTPAPLLKYSPHRIEIQAELDQPGYLVLLDSYYPGWRATVDGQPATIQRANVLFRAVALESGPHVVTFAYDPLTFKSGRAISLITLAGLIITTLRLFLRRHAAIAGSE
ncbi:MAG: YfhO family protein [Anaerolineae bacterium]